ncbi:uncharacterized protein LOC116345537 [Contarinia nasturtii]|uniref:uncharacterized protein LOC116345537 n=1 Tax=Contarinia nasturtii TaxID=265458 RepID=UPI0012D3ACA5|nr:uncharacterized protein LOC116345537 [Contarinia nasturtii]
MSLFDIHRSRNLFKVKESMQLKAVHNLGSFNKYMEKCLNLLNKYLEITPNWYSQLVLVLQFNKVTRNRACLHLKLHQKQRLYTVIFMNFIRIANSHLRQFSQNTAKSKSFLNFLMKIYELYGILNSDYIESMHINAYSKLLIECYRLCANGAATKHMTGKSNNDEFQKALDFCAIESKKITKKPPTKANQADKNNPATSSNTDEMVNPKKLKSK